MARIESPGGAGDSEPVKKLDGDNRKGNGVAFVLAVYAASRLLYLFSGPLLARVVPTSGFQRATLDVPFGSMNLWSY